MICWPTESSIPVDGGNGQLKSGESRKNSDAAFFYVSIEYKPMEVELALLGGGHSGMERGARKNHFEP